MKNLNAMLTLIISMSLVVISPLATSGPITKNLRVSKLPRGAVAEDVIYRSSRPVTITDSGGFNNPVMQSRNGKVTHLSGGEFNVGDVIAVEFDGEDGTRIDLVGHSYKKDGKIFYERHNRDPVTSLVVSGGDTGTSFLGYDVPANSYGYFYETWAGINSDGDLFMDEFRIYNYANDDPFNFEVLNYSSDTAILEETFRTEFDLDGNQLLKIEGFESALLNQGVSPFSWRYDTSINAAVADFDLMLSGMQGSQILAFTSMAAPFVDGGIFGDFNSALNVLNPVDEESDFLNSSFSWSGQDNQGNSFQYVAVTEPETYTAFCIGLIVMWFSRRKLRK